MSTPQSQTARIHALDLARSFALVGMVIYHSVYDLTWFGVLPAGIATTGFWSYFARTVAGSFVFIAGVSLYLAHGHQFRARAYLRRLGVLALAAAGVSLATYVSDPVRFVYFGILHSIAVSSLIGLAFLRLPSVVSLLGAAVFFAVPYYVIGGAFDHLALVWLGLGAQHPPSMDYEPVFPWAGPFLLGLALAKAADAVGLWQWLRGRGESLRWLAWPGRHSLAIYLVHQPILFGLAYLAARALA
ncbi:DUF1624 domain-containing protein [Sinirhodobacter sp. WL0062]|uniref:DUF1624 domain-containing protein n=1 Tax=Rhodobacter flavimaris TaxID=2907145 RepID=A0ABS8YXS8_9RHOB|nr:heparan-alpha-glucosaminide N-acetyltransferase [Sinirhodobacter sp. WL0062]MCE5974273.1 DUF1624 domain-containing protein [Sinirhodobacter sp. WL0062]